MTEKEPAQSSRAVIRSASRCPTLPGLGIGMRSKTTPHVRGSADPLASSPKSLSKVSRMRSSRAAHASTSGSVVPGAATLTQTTSCPAASRAVTAAPGKFSLARKRILGRAREYFLRAQRIACVGKTSDDVVVGNTWVIPEDIGLAPSVGHQADHEFDRNPRPADDRFAGEHVGGERNARMLRHGRLALRFSRLTLLEFGARGDAKI